MMVRASIRLPGRPQTERGKQKRATDVYSPATLARSLAVMGSDASRNTNIATEHTKQTIQVLAKEPVASNSTPETMAPTVPNLAFQACGHGHKAYALVFQGNLGHYRRPAPAIRLLNKEQYAPAA